MKRLIHIILVVVVVLVSATCPYSQTRPRRVTQPSESNTVAENTRSRTVEQPLETRETPIERPQKQHHNWMRILGTAAIVGATVAAGSGSCTPSRDVFRGRPR